MIRVKRDKSHKSTTAGDPRPKLFGDTDGGYHAPFCRPLSQGFPVQNRVFCFSPRRSGFDAKSSFQSWRDTCQNPQSLLSTIFLVVFATGGIPNRRQPILPGCFRILYLPSVFLNFFRSVFRGSFPSHHLLNRASVSMDSLS